MSDRPDFALCLYNWRMTNSLTQVQAADKLGVSANTVSQWESRHATPRRSRLEQISPIIGFSNSVEPEQSAPEPEPTPEPVMNARARMEERDRERRQARLADYMARNREMVAARDGSTSNENSKRDKLLRLQGFLEGMQAMMNTTALQKQIDFVCEIIEEDENHV